MLLKRDLNKDHQVIVKPKSLNNSEENGEETGGKVVFITNVTSHNNSTLMILISSFSQKQVINLMIMISIVVNVRFEQRLGNFNTNH